MAPADFGTLSNALLVANTENGHINGHDPMTGQFIGSVIYTAGSAGTRRWEMFISVAEKKPHEQRQTMHHAAQSQRVFVLREFSGRSASLHRR